MKDISIEYNVMDYGTNGMIEITVSGRDIRELFQEMKVDYIILGGKL